MRTTLAALALTAGLATTGVALAAPAAFAQDAAATASPSAGSTATDWAASRLAAVKDALTGLVSDGTITQAQADEVASTLSTSDALRGGGGRHGGGVDREVVAQALGITVEELRTQQEAGTTLAQIAEAEGVSRADLISRLVAAAKTQLAADVTAGRLTQAQADERSADLQARITERVDAVRPSRGGDVASSPPSATATPSGTA